MGTFVGTELTVIGDTLGIVINLWNAILAFFIYLIVSYQILFTILPQINVIIQQNTSVIKFNTFSLSQSTMLVYIDDDFTTCIKSVEENIFRIL